jgi:hypothetical protein
MFKIFRRFLIDIISGKDLTVIANVKLDSKQGVIINFEGCTLFKNVEITNFKNEVTINNEK